MKQAQSKYVCAVRVEAVEVGRKSEPGSFVEDHDARLLLLMDHVLSLRGEKMEKSPQSPSQPYLLETLSKAPNVLFPDHQVGNRLVKHEHL